MVVRVPGLAYQKGFGGHFHNDNCVGALRDIPGLVIAAPARGDDAARMLRGALAMAAEDGRRRRLPRADRALPREGPARRWRRRLADRLPRPAGDRCCRARWASTVGGRWRGRRPPHQLRQRPATEPPGGEAPRRGARRCGRGCSTCAGSTRCRPRRSGRTPRRSARVLVVDECRATGGGIADAIVADLAEQRIGRRLARCGRSTRSCRSDPPRRPCWSASTRSWPRPSRPRTSGDARPPRRRAR